ncbi:unnamed protein product [Periconia digitata]|uniref:lytic cellulose monooxygenase (C4-dehydrogenating) n=1 Tax=Periconia digitata TaxID=1303443 RepID=A0A9W4UUM5_9PLEO|nr:unnamed protein product [Periconia digitata]
MQAGLSGTDHRLVSHMMLTNTDNTHTTRSRSFPVYEISSPDIVCGASAFPVRNPDIQTATILAGDQVGFHLSSPDSAGDAQPIIFHEGPGQVFLSPLPADIDDLRDYDVTGQPFFKIAFAGPNSSTTWELENESVMKFNIPATTPPGKYVMRIEHFMPNWIKGQSQWFVSCAHVDIVGKGGGSPSGFISFPGAYKEDDPSTYPYLK